MRGQQRRIHALVQEHQIPPSRILAHAFLKPKVALCRRPDTLRPVSDDQPSSLSARLISYLCPIYGLFTIADSIGKKIILLVLALVQLLVGLGILWAAGLSLIHI